MPSSPPETLTDDSAAFEVEKGATEAPQELSLPVSPPPEGGFRAWLNVGGAFLVLFCGFGQTNGFGVLEVSTGA